MTHADDMNDDWIFLRGAAHEVAPRLLGCLLVRSLQGRTLVGRIVETEAYDQTDAASHSYRGQTARTEVMFGPAGRLYVYFTYGMHYCCNIVTGQEGHGAGVLIRAVEPLEGHDVMAERRGGRSGFDVTNGPAKICQAMDIDKRLSGHDLRYEPLQLAVNPALPADEVVQTFRVGISQAKTVPWRFYVKDNPFVSKH